MVHNFVKYDVSEITVKMFKMGRPLQINMTTNQNIGQK